MSGNFIISLQELKQVASDYGYKLVKKTVKTPLKPCKCGCEKPEKLSITYGAGKVNYIYRCPVCWRQGKDAKTVKEAKENWNKIV